MFDDAACTSLLHSETKVIDNLLVSRLKLFKPQQGVKRPKTAEIRTTLTGVAASGNLYLWVSGSGVVPMGGACQAWAAHAAPLATCFDGLQNQDETDVDCGGTVFPQCPPGAGCSTDSDCGDFGPGPEVCVSGTCTLTRFDGLQNFGESDVDCGAVCEPERCNAGENCFDPGDCDSDNCVGGICP